MSKGKKHLAGEGKKWKGNNRGKTQGRKMRMDREGRKVGRRDLWETYWKAVKCLRRGKGWKEKEEKRGEKTWERKRVKRDGTGVGWWN